MGGQVGGLSLGRPCGGGLGWVGSTRSGSVCARRARFWRFLGVFERK